MALPIFAAAEDSFPLFFGGVSRPFPPSTTPLTLSQYMGNRFFTGVSLPHHNEAFFHPLFSFFFHFLFISEFETGRFATALKGKREFSRFLPPSYGGGGGGLEEREGNCTFSFPLTSSSFLPSSSSFASSGGLQGGGTETKWGPFFWVLRRKSFFFPPTLSSNYRTAHLTAGFCPSFLANCITPK